MPTFFRLPRLLAVACLLAAPLAAGSEIYIANGTQDPLLIAHVLQRESSKDPEVDFSYHEDVRRRPKVRLPALLKPRDVRLEPGEIAVFQAVEPKDHSSVLRLQGKQPGNPLHVRYTVEAAGKAWAGKVAACVPEGQEPPRAPFAEMCVDADAQDVMVVFAAQGE